MADEDATKDELQEELRQRDLPVSGTKDELEQRLRDEGDDEPRKKASKKTASKKATKKTASKKATKKASKKTAKKASKKATKKASKKASGEAASKKQASKQQPTKKQGAAKMSTSSQQDTSGQRDTSEGQSSGSSARREAPSGPPKAGEIARLAARQLAELTRHKIEGISGLGRDEDGWRVEVEVVEVHRVPSSTDVMGTYAVYVDGDGELISYERVERFVRGQASGGGEG